MNISVEESKKNYIFQDDNFRFVADTGSQLIFEISPELPQKSFWFLKKLIF